MNKTHQIDLNAIGKKFRELLDESQRPYRPTVSANARRDCFDDAIFQIAKLKKAGQRISLLDMAAKLLNEHPRCGMSKAELSEAVDKLVIARGTLQGTSPSVSTGP